MPFLVFLTAISCVLPAGAAQTYFYKSYRGVGVEFNYRWTDFENKEHKAQFTLRQDDTNLGEREFQPFDNKKAQKFVYESLKKKAKELSTAYMTIRVKNAFDRYEFEVDGRANPLDVEQRIALLKEEQQKAMNTYVTSMMYQYAEDGSNEIMPDYAKISQRYTRMMAPVARALMKDVRRMDEREVANKVLSFLQNIPYDTLRSRYTSNGAGFQTPSGLLSGNRGDCDTKSVTFAAIMRNIYPRSRILIVQVPGHALVGFNFGEKAGDKALHIKGIPFVLAEPVGPGLAPLGVVSPNALHYLESGDFSYKEMPI